MKREIKFRGWDSLNKVMMLPKDIINLTGDTSKEVDTYLTLMQFTGLFDKNNTPIYEGDIIFSSYSKLKSEIKFGEFLLQDESCNDYAIGFYFHSNKPDLAFGKDIHGTTDGYEVIGNIYEQPELLNQK